VPAAPPLHPSGAELHVVPALGAEAVAVDHEHFVVQVVWPMPPTPSRVELELRTPDDGLYSRDVLELSPEGRGQIRVRCANTPIQTDTLAGVWRAILRVPGVAGSIADATFVVTAPRIR